MLGNWYSKKNRGLIIGAWATCANIGNIIGIQLAAILIDVFEGKWEKKDIENLHKAGCDDGEILEVNQVCAYFNYSNRLLNGLGVTTQGDVIGYYKDSESK
jgi:MFS family permease